VFEGRHGQHLRQPGRRHVPGLDDIRRLLSIQVFDKHLLDVAPGNSFLFKTEFVSVVGGIVQCTNG
jgi:hypothetical protein